MITDARVLQEEFVPDDVTHRNSELNQLSTALDPLIDGGRADNAVIFGPTGAGKTCCAQYTVEQLREAVLDVNTQYVNCWQDYNRYRVLYRLLDGLGKTVDIHRQSTPRDVLIERLREADDHPYVVILDEVDQLEDTRVLYDLYTLPHVSTILIANDEEEFFAGLDDRIYSRLTGTTRIRFTKYEMDELVAILEDRVRWGLKQDVIETRQLEEIADAAAGDARVAIGILRTAARQARKEGRERISSDVVAQSVPETRQELKERTIEKLTVDQRVLYEIIDEEDTIKPSTLYERYEEEVEQPKTRRTVRNYLSKMEHYDIITSVGENRGRRYAINSG